MAPVQKQWSVSANGEAVHDAVLTHHDEWRGTPYRLGGTDRAGIDCSAYMQQLFADQFAVQLPRTTLEQMRLGEPVSRSALKAGDLVFFQPSSKGRHVGVYLSEGFFVHAGTSSGVTVSDLTMNYWRSSYVTAKRVLVTPE
ncbi:MAG: NlpC/P60 family protein [Limnobacter sp.]|nr:NlpC/P60 family protein [Limnobacter sp.]